MVIMRENDMYSLLVVDDEEYVVRGITKGIEWTDIAITNVFEALECLRLRTY